ncbi:hypothetical protein BKA65DRAFT_506762 [Rhexocercosporidium sp. MPI-PUGE-AT-0058]|nr:hypothetical protein BKA65DRAFT_506762 [Rhexocercosporidium sp. MPI-PUGE-AT-0058]
MSSRGRGRGRGKPTAPPVSSGIKQAAKGHRKTNSEEKKKKMRESLGSTSGGQESRDASGAPSKTHLLVVNGSRNSAMLGDFLGLLDFFKSQVSPRFGADFWTLFTPQMYFESATNLEHTNIKFDGRVVANKFEPEHYTQDYQYVEATQLCQRVYQWIDLKCDETKPAIFARPGDSIVLIIIGHGFREPQTFRPLGIRMGNNNIYVTEFVEQLRKVPRDVQVNVISTACYGSCFAQAVEADGQADRWIQFASKPGEKAWAADRSASGRFQNSGFFAGLVRSLGGLGRSNNIDLSTLQTQLEQATQDHPDSEKRSTPYMYTDSPSTTHVHNLLLRKFADFPLTPENSAARRRKELNINMFKRPYPVSAAMMEKTDFAVKLIADEHESFGDQSTSQDEDNFEAVTRNDKSRRLAAGHILKGMLIRGRLQAAVFEAFMLLCLHGACSLEALEHPVSWHFMPDEGTCLDWIFKMLGIFEAMKYDWMSLQQSWGIPDDLQWNDYLVPLQWLATMIARSFTSLTVVFDILDTMQQLGPVDTEQLSLMIEKHQPKPEWKADMDTNRGEKWRGNGTFAFWLPENVDSAVVHEGFDGAALKLSNDFYQRLEKTEEHYAAFFDIPRKVFDADVLDGEKDVRDWSF